MKHLDLAEYDLPKLTVQHDICILPCRTHDTIFVNTRLVLIPQEKLVRILAGGVSVSSQRPAAELGGVPDGECLL